MRILIAEDDLTSRELLIAQLRRLGHQAVATSDGLEAWSVLKRPDAPLMAILDWMMPNLDGLAVLGKLRRLSTEPPPYVIMLTALGDKAHLAEALDAGADDYLIKPVHPVELRARIDVGTRLVLLLQELAAQNRKLRATLNQVKTLSGIVPICMHCKRVRDDALFWQKVEDYVAEHTEARFSHGLCPQCEKEHYPRSNDDVT